MFERLGFERLINLSLLENNERSLGSTCRKCYFQCITLDGVGAGFAHNRKPTAHHVKAPFQLEGWRKNFKKLRTCEALKLHSYRLLAFPFIHLHLIVAF
jgi:hypothetical protein